MTEKSKTGILGAWGEARAAEHLQQFGYDILERNFRAERGEIDIIARKNNTIVFVEVKTARSRKLGPPESWVDQRKQAQIGKVASAWLMQHAARDRTVR